MCTGIKLDYLDGSVLARTMDFEHPIDFNVVFFPRGYKAFTDLDGNDYYSKYETMGLVFNNYDPLKDGINEHGLMGITNDYTVFNIHSAKPAYGKFNISSLHFMSYVLANYKNVDEVIGDIKNINFSLKNNLGERIICPYFHFYLADKEKKSIVIESKGGELFYYENPYGVMTNAPHFKSHIKKLEKTYKDIDLRDFNGAKNLPGGYDSTSRFLKAYYFLKTEDFSENFDQAIASSYSIMNAMSMPKGFIKNKSYKDYTYTRYISLYESSRKILQVKSYKTNQIFQLTFSDIENRTCRQEFFIPENNMPIRLKANQN
ncbi:linear amide C-N hydrolase [Citroniella saccharovorans]|uniref:linear amide C-N hydrolase n=1 Tax=Citroniella saccharovorans TaxID=2053367 RepID=UPI00360C1B45